MSNQFYDYLTTKLYEWLEKTEINNGDRYYLLLNNQDEVQHFMNSIQNDTKGIIHDYELIEDGLNYSPPSIIINDIRIIFASNDENVTADFLVTLRNRVGTNNEVWKNTALIFISSKALDSIVGGATSLMRTDGPFHIQSLRENLDFEVEESQLSVSEKKLLFTVIKETMGEGMKLTLNDFENVYSMLKKENISSNDFNNLGYFHDEQLESYRNNKEISERLSLNRELFEKTSEAHDYENVKDKLEETFEGKSVITSLSNSDSWKDTSFKQAKKGYDEKEDTRKVRIDFLSEKFNSLNKNIKHWVRNDTEYKRNTANNRRTNHIILFPDPDKNNFKIKIPFDQNISKEEVTPRGFNFYINNKKDDNEKISYDSSRKNLVLEVNDLDSEDIAFGEIKYKYQNKIQFRFYFLILKINPLKLESIQTLYRLNIREQKIELTESIDQLQIGAGNNSYNKSIVNKYDGKDLNLDSDVIYNLNFDNYEYESDDDLNKEFYLVFKGNKLQFLIKEDKSTSIPRNSIYIDKKRRESEEVITYNEGKILQGTNIYYPFEKHKRLLELEYSLIQKGIFSMDLVNNKWVNNDIELPKKIHLLYLELYNYLNKKHSLLSLENYTGEVSDYVKDIITEVDSIFLTLKDDERISEKIKNIIKIGTFIDSENKKIYLSPLNPILIYYNSIFDNELKREDVHENILKKLSVSELIPFMNIDGELYESYFDDKNYRWLEYQEVTNKNNKLSTYIRKIVMTKLQDYYRHFSYLFSLDNPEINIRIFNIYDEKEILIGIVEFLLKQINKNNDTYLDLININIFIENQTSISSSYFDSKFNKMYQIEDVDEFSQLIENRLSKYDNLYFSKKDIMNEIKNKIDVFYSNESNDNQQYHITFYKFIDQENPSLEKSYKLDRNYALGGLSNSKIFTKIDNRYVSGFGLDTDSDTPFISLLNKWNSILAAIRNKGHENYHSNQVLVNNIKDIDAYLSEQEMEKLFNSSSWVSFINPDVDLRYFDDKNNELFVIHYSDQSNTQTYESITVTKEIEQYKSVLNEHLKEYTSRANDSETENIIRSFNLLNGEWLLRIIGEKNNNQNIVREKLSIIAGYKNLMSLLEKPSIYWAPISLAEILRVSRMLGLDGDSDLFSAKMLNTKGETSDDLLFIGLEVTDHEELKLHFLPTEVKIGNNKQNVIEKAFKQVTHTSKILTEELTETDDAETSFTKKFYRNFFVQLYLSNIEKIISNNLWSDKNYEKVLDYRGKLLDDDFSITNDLKNQIGSGLILSFKTENAFRKIEYNEDKEVSIVHLTENDAYDDVKRTIHEIDNIYKNNRREINSNLLYRNSIVDEYSKTKDEDIDKVSTELDDNSNNEEEISENNEISLYNSNKYDGESNGVVDELVAEKIEDLPEINSNNKINDISVDNSEKKKDNKKELSLEDIRVLVGKVKDSNSNLYWEFGNKGLANRHLLISGKSGQGKTYFMQTLLYELSEKNISSAVIDYTNGFTIPHLEGPFKERLDDKLVNHIIYSEKLPINPFAKFKMDIAGTGVLVEQSDHDMIDRVVSVLDFVFNLGIQQRYSLKQVLVEVYEKHGKNITFTKVKDVLEDKGENSLLGRIDTLISRDPFSYDTDNFTWEEVFNNKGEVHIFQLAGYQPQLQKVLTEFLLWDMYNYTTLNGSKDNPIPMLLDEAQNLNFKESSPTTKIMTEGRKYGWSAWFATQSLSAIDETGGVFNAAEQIHFQPPEDQIKNVANKLGSSEDRKHYRNELSNLQKGEALVSGPILNQNNEFISSIEMVSVTSFEDRK